MQPPRLDQNFLNEVGLADLSREEKLAMLAYARELLEVRVGEKLAEGIPDKLLQEFYSYARQNQPEKALAWIRQHAPNYGQVVQAEISRLRLEIKSNAELILKHSKDD